MKFAFVHAEKAEFPVAAICRLLGVTRQGYYAFVSRGTSSRTSKEEFLRQQVTRIHTESRGTYGSPRVLKQLQAEGVRIGKRRIERSMQELGIVGRERRRFRTTTTSNPAHHPAPNTLNRNFSANAPNRRWVTDITYVWTAEGWCYLAAIIDLYSRSVVGWELSTSLETQLPVAALHMALSRRVPEPGLMHHSDRGCQYTSSEYQALLSERGIEVSMSRKGNCWDNAVAESFFSTVKTELIHRKHWSTRVELRAALFDYIEIFYNRQRIHSSIRYKSPIQFEADSFELVA
jgi:transposase InsO family protein